MAKYAIENETLVNIADAVRELRVEEEQMTPAEMAAKIHLSTIGLPVVIEGGLPSPWVRPSDWPDLDSIEMDDDFDGLYLTYDLRKTPGYGWIGLYVEMRAKTEHFFVEHGHLESGVFVADESHELTNTQYFRQYLDEADGDVQLWRVYAPEGHIIACRFVTDTATNANNQNNMAQPCVERVGQLRHITKLASDSMSTGSNYVTWGTIWLERCACKIGGDGNCTSMASSYHDCWSLRELDLSGWDTSNWVLTRIDGLFSYCYRLETVDLSYFDTSKWKVTGFNSMFNCCYALREIRGMDTWDMSLFAVTTFSSMFYYCLSLRRVDLTWDTADWRVTNLSSMFHGCYALIEAVMPWDTSNWAVTTMSSMFSDCRSLQRADMHTWDTTGWAVTTLASMFSNCWCIQEIDMTNWDTTNWPVTLINAMFNSCFSLKEIKGLDWNTTGWAVTNVSSIFSNCVSLEELVLTWDTSNWAVTNTDNMFNACRSLESLDVSVLDTTNWAVTTCSSMYASCYDLRYLRGCNNPGLYGNSTKCSPTMLNYTSRLIDFDGIPFLAGGSITAHMMTTEATDNMLNALPTRSTAATLTIPGSQTRRASDGVIAAAEARGWTIKAS